MDNRGLGTSLVTERFFVTKENNTELTPATDASSDELRTESVLALFETEQFASSGK